MTPLFNKDQFCIIQNLHMIAISQPEFFSRFLQQDSSSAQTFSFLWNRGSISMYAMKVLNDIKLILNHQEGSSNSFWINLISFRSF